MRLPVPLVVLFAALALAAPARAQRLDERAISFGIGGGASAPLGDARSSYLPGFDGDALVRLDLGALPLAVRADFTYQNFELRHSVIPAGAGGGGTGTLLGGVGALQVYLRRGGVRPYLLAGAGAYSVRTEYDAATLATQSETRFGARGGAGVMLTFGSLLLYAEAAVDHVAPRTGAPVESAIDVVPMTVGVIF